MKMPFEYIDVIDGNFRIRCDNEHSVEQWIVYIVAKGHVPTFEMGPRS